MWSTRTIWLTNLWTQSWNNFERQFCDYINSCSILVWIFIWWSMSANNNGHCRSEANTEPTVVTLVGVLFLCVFECVRKLCMNYGQCFRVCRISGNLCWNCVRTAYFYTCNAKLPHLIRCVSIVKKDINCEYNIGNILTASKIITCIHLGYIP